MSIHPAPLANLPWTAGPHPLEKKKTCADGHLVQLCFAPGFEDPEWCERGHTLFVQSGTLRVLLRDKAIEIQAGNGVVLTRGTVHKAANPGTEPVTVLAIQHELTPRD